ncbi:MAG TPA: carboxymuconolactone decarboxylase family protein [Mycobacteriales bacterium]|nr:carboxymuconolactone decarboxylase family protein [Mycobacteriales bacterium]
MTERIRPGSRREVGVVGAVVAGVSGLIAGTEPPRLFLTLGRHRRLFRGWLRFAGRLMPGGRLPRRETELVILRVAHLRDCRYEFDHHVRLGRRAGVTATDVERLVRMPLDRDWPAREQALLDAVDALHERQDLDDGEWTALRHQLDERETLELLMLAGHYEMLATVIRVLRLEPDRASRWRRRLSRSD